MKHTKAPAISKTSVRATHNIRDVKTNSEDALWDFFTGKERNQLFVMVGDYVILQGIHLKTPEDQDGLNAAGWHREVVAHAKERGDYADENIRKEGYDGRVYWDADWLKKHFPEIRKRAKESKQTKIFW